MKRLILSALLAACQISAAYAQNCVWPDEKAAFEMLTLKNTLMVAALSCGTSNEYNDFVARFEPFMDKQQALVDKYFTRMGGGDGQAQEDGFMTQLSNDESQQSLNMGAEYCDAAGSLFDQVLSTRDEASLVAFADANTPDQTGPDLCSGTPAMPAPPAPQQQTALAEPTVVPPYNPPAAADPAPAPVTVVPAYHAPRVIATWKPPAPLAAEPLPAPAGAAAVPASSHPRLTWTAPRRPEHYAAPAKHPAAPVTKAPEKPTVTVVQI